VKKIKLLWNRVITMLEERVTSKNPQYGKVSALKRAKTINAF